MIPTHITKALKLRFASLAAIGILYPTAAAGAALCATTMFASPTLANTGAVVYQTMEVAETAALPSQHSFEKKTYKIDGTISVEQANGKTYLVLSDDFRTRSGPDLKIFLSKRSVADATGQNATSQAIKVSALTSNRGQQRYELPSGINIADFSSVLIHCEAFSKLWGGADLV